MTASKSQVGGAHYRDFAIQPSEFIHRNRIGFLEGNVIKYVCRHAAKNGRQDIEKAIHYLQLLLEWEYPDAPCRVPLAIPAAGGEPHPGYGLHRDIPGPACSVCED